MQEFLKQTLDYIEQNLKAEITADELAKMANYSLGHFCRLFAIAMDSTVASYILKRRLDHALSDISSGKKAIDVVLEYGFETYAGFYKAFVRMYGCSPKKYLNLYKKSEVFFMQNEKTIKAMLENWDIPAGLKIEDITTRHWKTGEILWQMWKIGDDYYLKTNERSKIIRNIRIAKALKKEGLLSEFLPVATTAGNDYVDGEHIFMLTKKVGEPLINEPSSGEDIMNFEYHENRTKHAHKLGQAIAKLHRALKSVQDDVMPHEANLYEQGLKSAEIAKEYAQKYKLAIGEDFFNDYEQSFGALYAQLPKQLIHGNPTGDCVVYEGDEIVGLKGHETYNVSHIRIFDIAYCAGEINTGTFETYLETLKSILAGYDSASPLTAQEKQSVYYVLCAISMNMLAYCDETLDVSKRNREALVLLSQNKEKFANLI